MQAVLLILALSIDIFIACAACGAEHITIGNRTALCVSGICSGVLFFSLTVGMLLDGVLKEENTTVLCFVGLFLVGAFKLIEYAIHAYIRKHRFLWKRVKISFSQLNFILNIYNNPVAADKDRSSTMSAQEGIFFALAMSLDGLFGGLGAAFLDLNLWGTVALNFLFSFLAVRFGSSLGRRVAAGKDRDISWLGGALFLGLAFSKLLK